TVMILLNALCFDGKWSEGYSSGDCENETFHGANGDRTVRMMYCDGDRYLYGPNETGFIKYYDGKYAFVALLPNRNMSLEKYLDSLNGDRFLSLLTIRSGTVRTGLPKFESDWSGSLKPALTELGMNAAFGDGADFSGMADLDTLKIGSVIHKTHIEVDESGTKAAAATAVGMYYESAPSSGPDYVVVLDRPFVYAIIDTEAKLPVFIGSIADIS
ncbi:MAG: proteinase inhibitor I4 serpin, partial [Lachnospiraceae bacterium]|nr:proteinase inhibitor I4 serpin [Lachnospiraceae bacterium]